MRKAFLMVLPLLLCSCGSPKYDKIHIVNGTGCMRIVGGGNEVYRVEPIYKIEGMAEVTIDVHNCNYILVREGEVCPICGTR